MVKSSTKLCTIVLRLCFKTTWTFQA